MAWNKRIAGLVGILVVVASCTGDDQAATAPSVKTKGQPKIQLGTTAWDFGEVWSGMPVETKVPIKNVGDAPLEITRTKASCGCTLHTLEKKLLAPGESTDLTITYDSKKHAVNVKQRVFILSNDPKSPQAEVTVTGKVQQVFEFQPTNQAALSWGQVLAEDHSSRELIIRNHYASTEKGQKIKLSLPENAKYKYFDVKLEEIAPGEEYKLIATTKPPLPKGVANETIQLQTDLDWFKQLTIGLNAIIAPKVTVQPSTLVVAERMKYRSTKRLRLYFMPTVDVKIESITTNSDQVTYELVNKEPELTGSRKCWTIDVSVPPGPEMPAAGYELTITTNLEEPEFKELKVPVQLVKAAARPRNRTTVR